MAGIYGGNIRCQQPNQLAPSSLNNAFLTGFLIISLVVVNFQTVPAQGDVRPFYPLYFTSQPLNTIVAEGGSVTLNCTVYSTSQPISIRWLKGQTEIDRSNSNFVVLSTGALRINSVSRTVEGNYHCAVQDNRGKMIKSREAVLAIATLSNNIPNPEDVDVHVGDTARFECLATGNPRPRISWQKDSTLLDLSMERIAARFALLPSGALEVRNLRSVDAGSYRCQATNDISGVTVQSRSAILTVLGGAPDLDREFEFIVSPVEVEARVGRDIVLEAATTEQATFTWFKDDEEIVLLGGQNHYSIVGQGSLRITDLGEIDTGLYRVRASAVDGSTLPKIVRVTAQVPPSFLVKPENAHANVGSPFTFKCSVYGIPPPEVKWLKDGENIDTSDNDIFTLVGGQNLQISQLIDEDDGTYQCVASNTVEGVVETIQAAAELIVLDQGVPIPAKPPTTTITPVVTTVNPVTTQAIPIGPATGPVPSKPRTLQASKIFARSVKVQWKVPLTTNGEIITYKIHIQQDGAQRQRIINVPANRLTWTIDDLVPQTNYHIYAYAVNENGQGETSDTLTIDTQGVVQVPNAPQNLVALPDSSASIFVSWEPPSLTFGDIQGYSLYYADLGTGQASREVEQSSITENSYTVEGLKPYTRYGFRVIAFNENGQGPSSETIEARTFTDRPTSPPSNVTVDPYSASSIVLKWNLPPQNQRNGDITGYKVRYRSASDGDKRAKTIVIDGVLREYIISELERDSEYEVRIGAVNINGTGPFTDWILARTYGEDLNGTSTGSPLGRPNPPHYLRATIKSPTSAFLMWDDQEEGCCDGRIFEVAYRTNYPANQNWKLVNTTDKTFVLNGLTPYTMYDFKVSLILDGARSDPSMSTNAKTLEAAPSSAPKELTINEVENSTTSLQLSWQPPKHANGIITGYTIYYSTDATLPLDDWIEVNLEGDELTTTLTSLTQDTMYHFRIGGANARGVSPISPIVSDTTPQELPELPELPVTKPPVIARTGAAAFPWWLWLLIVGAIFFILLLAILIVLCLVCGCCACCATCFPDSDCCGPCAPCCGALAKCWTSICPCCCADEEECAKCCAGLLCGATCCVCCGEQYKEKPKMNANGKTTSELDGPDLWSNPPLRKGLQGSDAMTKSPIDTELEPLNPGGGVDAQRDGMHETEFRQSSTLQRQNQDRDRRGTGQRNHNDHAMFDDQHNTEMHTRSALDIWAEENGPPAHTSRFNTWADRSRDRNDIHSSTYHRDDRDLADFRTRDYSSLQTGGFVPIRSGPEIQTLDRRRHGSSHNYDVNSNQVVTFPEGNYVGPETKPFTITFEETTTSHQVERSVPMLDGTSYKTVSNHETFAKSYTTSDAARDRNLQTMLANGLDTGPLAIEIPTGTHSTALPAITAPVSTLNRSQWGQGASIGSTTPSSSPSFGSYHMGGHNLNTLNENTNQQSLNATSYSMAHNDVSTNVMTDATTNMTGNSSSSHHRLGRSNSLDLGGDSGLIPSLGHLTAIRPPLLSQGRPRPPDYDTVSRAKKKASSAYNLNVTESDGLFDAGGDNSAFGRFHSSDFLSDNGGYGGGSSATTSRTTKYNTMDASTRMGLSGVDFRDPGYGTLGGSTENAFSSSVYGTSIESGGMNGGLSNGRPVGLHANSGPSSLLPNGLSSGIGGVTDDSYKTSSASRSYQGYSSAQQMGMAGGGGASYSFNNNNAATGPDYEDIPDMLSVSASQSDISGGTSAAMPYISKSKRSNPSKPRLQRSQSVDAISALELDADKYGFPKLYKHHPVVPVEAQQQGRPNRRQNASESQQDVRGAGVKGLPSMRRSGSVDGRGGYHSDTNTTSSHEDSASQMSSVSRPANPLSSFTVPGPPPHYQARVKISAPTYSPLKRGQGAGTVPGPRGRGQPLPVVTPRAPDVTVRGPGDGTSPTSSARTFSAEDLNAEMINLEGLMKDLNAITASELQS